MREGYRKAGKKGGRAGEERERRLRGSFIIGLLILLAVEAYMRDLLKKARQS